MLKLALATTVKNDFYFIKEFIHYYKKIGFDKIIIFDDGSSKFFLSKIPKDSSVSVISKDKSYELVGVKWLEKIKNQYHNSFDVRKRFNTYYACKFLKKEGFDWLFSCDTDEFIGSFKDEIAFELKKNLRNINVPQVLFLARDIVFDPKKTLFENTKFRSLGVRDDWFGKFYQILLSKIKSPLIDKSYQSIFNIISGKKITNIRIGNSNYIIPINPSYLGHKSLINLNYYDSNNFNIHYWVDQKSHRKLSYKILGALYHFDLLNAKQVYKKFRKRKDIGAFNGPDYRNLLELKAKTLSFRDFNGFYNDYMYLYNDVEAIEIKQIMNLLNNE